MDLNDAIEVLEDDNDLGKHGMDPMTRKRLKVKMKGMSKKRPMPPIKNRMPYSHDKVSSYQEDDMSLRDRGYEPESADVGELDEARTDLEERIASKIDRLLDTIEGKVDLARKSMIQWRRGKKMDPQMGNVATHLLSIMSLAKTGHRAAEKLKK
jgi:hypothetical protein